MVSIEKSVRKINGYMKGSCQWIIDVGTELRTVKEYCQNAANDKETYNRLYEALPFGKKVGEKFIAIANDALLKKNIQFCPPKYNTLYDCLLEGKLRKRTGLSAEKAWASLIKDGLTPLSTANEVKEYVDQIATRSGTKPKARYGAAAPILPAPMLSTVTQTLPTTALIPAITLTPTSPISDDLAFLEKLLTNLLGKTAEPRALEKFREEAKPLWDQMKALWLAPLPVNVISIEETGRAVKKAA